MLAGGSTNPQNEEDMLIDIGIGSAVQAHAQAVIVTFFEEDGRVLCVGVQVRPRFRSMKCIGARAGGYCHVF
jgi:hypothetical protein